MIFRGILIMFLDSFISCKQWMIMILYSMLPTQMAGSNWQPNIWSNSHYQHRRQSPILPAKCWRPQPCTEQVTKSLKLIHCTNGTGSFDFDIFFSFASFVSMHYDSPVLEVELNVDEMAKSHKAWTLVPRSTNFLSVPVPLFLLMDFTWCKDEE